MPLTKRSKPRRGSDAPRNGDAVSDADSVHSLKLELKREVQDAKAQTSSIKSQNRHWYLARKWIFPLGIFLGVLLGFALVQPGDLPELPAHLSVLLSEYQDTINIPQIIDFSRFENEWQRFRTNIPEVWKLNTDGREFQVGEEMKARGLSARYPIVLVPGIISTALESWSTEPPYREQFRVKVWGGFPMIQQVMFNREKWMQSMLLDPVTGLDPPGVKVRAAEGISAASSFIQGYWLWSKIVENLAVVNYDTNNLFLAPYDWRLSYHNLEVRDGYFSKLKANIEGLVEKENRKVVMAAHSMGSTVVLYFMKWVESPEHGKGGPDWVENHIEALITIAGTHLGVAKAMAAFLSGEMKDTVQMNPYGAYVLEQFFSKKERQRLFRSWAGSASMWLKGGATIWGNSTSAPDDPPGAVHTHGELISFRPQNLIAKRNSFFRAASTNGTQEDLAELEPDLRNMTAVEGGTWILSHTPLSFQKMMESNYSNGFEKDDAALERNQLDPAKWTNPLEVKLPLAPSMKMYCVYGHGKETERSYWYARGEYEYDEASNADAPDAVCPNDHDENCTTPRAPLDMPLSRSNWIDSDFTDETSNPKVINGVKVGEGDGTVSLLSLGAMCVEGWKRKRYNPGGIKVVTVELPHQPTLSMPRGGANTSDHVDILGSTRLNEIILKVATGAGDEIQDEYVSDIREYAARIEWD